MTRLEEQSIPAFSAAAATIVIIVMRRPAGDARPIGRGIIEVEAQPQGRIAPKRCPRGTAVIVITNAGIPDAASAPGEAVLDRQPPTPVGACGVHDREERLPLPPLPLLVRLKFSVVLRYRVGVSWPAPSKPWPWSTTLSLAAAKGRSLSSR